MPVKEREAKITWLNWKEMLIIADERRDDSFFKLPATFASRIETLCGTEHLLEWAEDELCEDKGFDPTVLYHVRNDKWPWDVMMKDLQALSAEFPEIVFQITFLEGESSAKAYLYGGRLTAVLYDSSSGSLIVAF